MAEDKHIVFSYGRMNPPTAGHSKVVDKVHSHAQKLGANHAVVVSHTQHHKNDPLHHEHKKEFLRHVHPEVNFHHSTKEHPTFLHQLKKFNQEGHTHATMVVGSDRVHQFKALAKKYNGKEYSYKKINILSAGHRDPDAEGVKGISGTKMRDHARANDYKSFKAGLHSNHDDEQAKKLYKATRDGMKLNESETSWMDFSTFLTEQSQQVGDHHWHNPHHHEEHDEVHTQHKTLKHDTATPNHVKRQLNHLRSKSNYSKAMKSAGSMNIHHTDKDLHRITNTDAADKRGIVGQKHIDKTKSNRVSGQFKHSAKTKKTMSKPVMLHDKHTGHKHLLAGNTRLTHGVQDLKTHVPVHTIQYNSSKK